MNWGPLPSERVLRSLMKSISERLKPANKLSAKQTMSLLRGYPPLADQLRDVVNERQKRKEQSRNTNTANAHAEAQNGLNE